MIHTWIFSLSNEEWSFTLKQMHFAESEPSRNHPGIPDLQNMNHCSFCFLPKFFTSHLTSENTNLRGFPPWINSGCVHNFVKTNISEKSFWAILSIDWKHTLDGFFVMDNLWAVVRLLGDNSQCKALWIFFQEPSQQWVNYLTYTTECTQFTRHVDSASHSAFSVNSDKWNMSFVQLLEDDSLSDTQLLWMKWRRNTIQTVLICGVMCLVHSCCRILKTLSSLLIHLMMKFSHKCCRLKAVWNQFCMVNCLLPRLETSACIKVQLFLCPVCTTMLLCFQHHLQHQISLQLLILDFWMIYKMFPRLLCLQDVNLRNHDLKKIWRVWERRNLLLTCTRRSVGCYRYIILGGNREIFNQTCHMCI